MITSIMQTFKNNISEMEEMIELYTKRLETETDSVERSQLTAHIEMAKFDILKYNNAINRLQNTAQEQKTIDAYALVMDHLRKQIEVLEQGQHAYTFTAAMWLALHATKKEEHLSPLEAYEHAKEQLEIHSKNAGYLKETLLQVNDIVTTLFPVACSKEEG